MLLCGMGTSVSPASRHIKDIVDDGYDVTPLQYLYSGWHVFKSDPVMFWGGALVLGLVNEALSRLWAAPLSSGSLRTELFYTLPIEMARLCLFHGVEAILLTLIAVMAWQRLAHQPFAPMRFVKDWRSLGRIFTCATVITLVAWAPMIWLTSLPSMGGPMAARITLPLVLVLTFIGLILFLYLMVAYTFSYLILFDRREGIWNALEGSRRVIDRHWWKVAAFFAVLLFLNVEPYCLIGSALEIVSPGSGFNWMCMSDLNGGQGAFALLLVTALGRAISGCVLAVAYADIYGMPIAIE